ncbi:RsmB/NOP family class I SAM-dependent RNA methyltransferase [Ruania halotolerans]|uniref:RsmB/NOP family class I SAM-dependent RNA methyltransferase n=1 Tax=Ruania halotolerans TaxID=2897773 RepID=UPI001E5C2101|nr:transcription antitermination factor NusB [Ruania halotolerans]UFU08288.1 rRNA small subunit methyltransferase B [Ruania halotolerans]
MSQGKSSAGEGSGPGERRSSGGRGHGRPNSGRRGSSPNRPDGDRDRSPRQRTAQRPAERARDADPARRAAFDTLRTVADSDAYANLTLPPMLRQRGVRGRDAAFATELAYGTLRYRDRYDAVIATVSSRPLAQLDPPVLDVLRLGAHQVLAMRVPDHAAVSATVGLARSTVGAGAAQFVNAILRQVTQRPLEEWLEIIGSEITDETERLALTSSHPAWIVRALRHALTETSQGAEDLPALLEADNTAPAVTVVLRPGLSTDEDVPDAAPGQWTRTARLLAHGDPAALDAVRNSRAGVQDEGSQLVTLAAAAAPLDGSDSSWLDLCAGPGGKAALFGALLAERAPGGRLLANEISAHRARLVEQSTAALREVLPGLEVRTGDGREVGPEHAGRAGPAGGFDRVLVDVPCTGLGALRRRPEARWRRTPTDLATLGPLQRELLTAALAATRPGGVVAYVTCSPHVAETRMVVEDVLKRTEHAQVLDAVEVASQVSPTPLTGQYHQDGPYLQLWPHRHGTDAMFLALIRR